MEPRMASRARVRIGVFMIGAIDGEFCRFCRTVTRNQIGNQPTTLCSESLLSML